MSDASVTGEVRLLRPARRGEPDRAGAHLFKPLRQAIESINETLKGQLDLERRGEHTPHRRSRPRPATHPHALTVWTEVRNARASR